MEVELAQVKERLAQLQSRKGELEAVMGSGPRARRARCSPAAACRTWRKNLA